MSLHSSESAATRYICQMRSTPAANQTRHVGSVTCAVPLGYVADIVNIQPYSKLHPPL